jgi:hypothetical protein
LSASSVAKAPLVGERGDHDHGHRTLGHQQRERGQTVHLGHVDVERDDIRFKGDILLDRLASVAREPDLEVALALEDGVELTAHQRRIVDDQ